MLILNLIGRHLTWIFTFLFVVSVNGNILSPMSKTAKLDNDEIASLTSKLSKKIILSDTQTNQVSSILTNYSKQLDEIRNTNSAPDEIGMKQLMSSTADKINALLDAKQKMKYDIIKNDWWKEINTEAND